MALASASVAGAQTADRVVEAQAEASTPQTAAGDGDIVVTARKRTERLRDVPTAGTALDAAAIKDLGGIPTAQSLLTNSPGVNFSNTSNPVTSEISIRGSGTSRATNASTGVGLYRDGAYIGGGTVGGRTFSDLDFFDVGRVEVLRGVQGGLQGRNAVGGAINIVSVRPSDRADGFAQLMISSPGLAELQLAVGTPIDDHWSVRFGVDVQHQWRGFYKLPVLDQYADIRNKRFVRGQVRYATAGFTANLLAEYGKERLPGLVYQANNLPSATYPTGLQQDRFRLPWNFPSRGDQEMSYFELTTSTEFDFADLETTTSYRDRTSSNSYDRDATSIEFLRDAVAAGKVAPAAVRQVLAADYRLDGLQADTAHIFVQDVHLNGKKTGGFTWLVGGEVYLLRDKPYNFFGRTPTTANPSPGTIDRGRQKLDSFAAYGALGYDVTDNLTLSGDIRVTRDDEAVQSVRRDAATGLAVGTGFNINGTRKATNVSYTATAAYKPSPDSLLYLKVGSAFRAGGFNTALGDPRQPIPVPTTFNNETVTAYEAGFKGDLARSLYFTTSVYLNKYKNLVVPGNNGCAVGLPVCPVQATSFAFNGGPARLWGLEAELSARRQILDGTFRLSLGGSRQGGHITGGIYNGRMQPQQPKWTATLNANYRHGLGGDWTGFANFKGSGRFGGQQEIVQTQPLYDYVIADARLGIERGALSLALFSENITNKSYIVFRTLNAVTDVRRFNIPRTWGVQLRYDW